jgi:hypothetical protein
MKPIASRLGRVAIVGPLIMMWSTHNGWYVAAAQQHTPATVTRIYSGSDGLTHAEQIDVKLTPLVLHGQTEMVSEKVKVASSYFVSLPSGSFTDWHAATARRYVVTLSGRAEIEVAGGQKIPLEPGHTLQIEDVTGKGHTLRILGKTDWIALFVQFDQ